MRVLIVDDHTVVRQGIRRLLHSALPGLDPHEAGDAAEALALLARISFDVALIDLSLPGDDGFFLIGKAMALDDRNRLVVFTMHGDISTARRALRMGARGYVCKCAPAEELVTAVKTVAGGGRYVDREMAETLAVSPVDEALQALNEREIEILRLLGEGKSLKDIAEISGRTYKTVSNTCGAIKMKLGLRSSAELVRLSLARQRGLAHNPSDRQTTR